MISKTNPKILLTVSLLLAATVCATTKAKTVYVDTDATGANNGSSWANAYNYLQDARADANVMSKPVEIRVAEGVYTPDSNSANPTGSGDRTATYQLINGVAFYGGYAGDGQPDPNARDINLYETILSGDLGRNDVGGLSNPSRNENSYHVVTGSGTDATAVLDGFTITGGHADELTGSYMIGAGMYNAGGGSSAVNNTFRHNWAFYGGGGMWNSGGSPSLTNCVFIVNGSNGSGGGLFNGSSSPTLMNCTFRGNSADYGGGMFNDESESKLVNCIFSGNRADYGGGMCNINVKYCHWNWAPKLTNCTFYGNDKWAIYNSTCGSVVLRNCILWGDTPQEISDSNTSIVSYCNIDADPCFVDVNGPDDIIGTADDNLRLLPGSSCIDAGNNSAVPSGITIDLDGHPRIVDGDCNNTQIVDMGAYEFAYIYFGDFDGDCKLDVNMADFAIFGLAWLTGPGNLHWNPDCDISIPPDNSIDARDLAVFVKYWLAGVEP